jgi:hypothetical protein
MKCIEQKIYNDEDNMNEDDTETLDELLYDSESVEKKMNEIFEKTKNVDVFVKIYEMAAAHMFSLDLETGLAVLLSYDYFPLFYTFYQKYYENNNGNEFEESLKEYSDLVEKINPNKKIS